MQKKINGIMITTCDRCNVLQSAGEGYNGYNMDLCETCLNNQSVTPGEYAYVLHLWLIHDQGLVATQKSPHFWPRSAENKPLTVMEILSIALKNDISTLPCGAACTCLNIAKKLQDNTLSTSGKECAFLRMPDGLFKTALLLYWWLVYYTKSSTHPDFWPSYTGKGLLSPQEMVKSALNIA